MLPANQIMDFEGVKAWLAVQNQKQIRTRWMLAVLGLVLTPLALAAGAVIVFWFVFAIYYRSTGSQDWHTPLWISLAVIPALFVINRFIPKTNYTEQVMSEGPATSLGGYYSGRSRTIMVLFQWIVLTGPRLVDWSIYSFREITRLKQQDTHSCAAVLWVLLVKRNKVPFDALKKELDWLDLEGTLPQLRRIPGVLFLKTAPPGLSLTDDLRTAIRGGEAHSG